MMKVTQHNSVRQLRQERSLGRKLSRGCLVAVLSLLALTSGGRASYAAVPCVDAPGLAQAVKLLESSVSQEAIMGAINAGLDAGMDFIKEQMLGNASTERVKAQTDLAAIEIQTNAMMAGFQEVTDNALKDAMTSQQVAEMLKSLPPPNTKQACVKTILNAGGRGGRGFVEGYTAMIVGGIMNANRGPNAHGQGPLYSRQMMEMRCKGGLGPVTGTTQKVSFGSAIDGYPEQCRGVSTGKYATVDLDQDLSRLRPPMMAPQKKMIPNADGGQDVTFILTGTPNTDEFFQQQKAIATQSYCQTALGPYPAKAYAKQMATQDGAAAATGFDSNIISANALVTQCVNYFAKRTRPNPNDVDSDSKTAYAEGVRVCEAAKQAGVKVGEDTLDCMLGLSEVEQRNYKALTCATIEQAVAYSESGAGHDTIMKGSDFCGLNQLQVEQLEQEEEAAFVQTIAELSKVRGSFPSYQNTLITAQAQENETPKRNVNFQKREADEDATSGGINKIGYKTTIPAYRDQHNDTALPSVVQQ